MIAEVRAWGRRVGAVMKDRHRIVFQYDPSHLDGGLNLSPLQIPFTQDPYHAQRVPEDFLGLPGLLADSLPDRFGNALIDAWLSREGLSPQAFGPIERLCYIGKRGMGALEFHPVQGPRHTTSRPIDIGQMVELADLALKNRQKFKTDGGKKEKAIKDLLTIGTSAGGARAKAVIAFNEKTGEIRSGQVEAKPGFEHYLLKFDGVSDPTRETLSESDGFGRIEFLYYLLAKEAGIQISESRLFKEGGRAHFMTKRFDRIKNQKIHVQTLSALDHLDFNLPHSYEQAVLVANRLGVSPEEKEEILLRAMFNVMFRNQDDHVKNVSFMLKDGKWGLAPAYDLTFAFNPAGQWTHRHQMTIAGKSDDFMLGDFRQMAKTSVIRAGAVKASLERLMHARSKFVEFADRAGIESDKAEVIRSQFRDIG